MNQVNEFRRHLAATAWALAPEYMNVMVANLDLIARGGAPAEATLKALEESRKVEAARRQSISASTGGAVVVLPLYGLITQRSNFWSYFFGGTSTEAFTMQFRAALADPNVQAIVIDVDSPGGSVSGVDELAAEIFAGRKKKTIVALSNTLNASAAYYLSSQASKLYVMPSSLTGSIGVYQTHEDDSKYLDAVGVKLTLVSAGKYKVEGNNYEPLTDEARAAMQKMVDGFYEMFVKAVARGRGVKADAIRNGYGEGRVLMAADAIREGLADDTATLDSVLAQFGVARPADGSASYATQVEPPTAEAAATETVAAEGETPEASAETDPPSAETPEAKKSKADELDDNDDGDEDGNGNDDVDPDDDDDTVCKCKCKSCVAGDHAGCTAEEKCGAHANAADERHQIALEQQRRHIALTL